MTWKSKFNWQNPQKLSSLKGMSVRVSFWSILWLQWHEYFSHVSHRNSDTFRFSQQTGPSNQQSLVARVTWSQSLWWKKKSCPACQLNSRDSTFLGTLRESLGFVLKHPTAAVTRKLLTPFTSTTPCRHWSWTMHEPAEPATKIKIYWHLGTGCNYNRSWRLICFHQAVVSTFRLTLTVAHTIHAGAKERYHVIFNRLLTRLNVMFCLFSTGRKSSHVTMNGGKSSSL